MTVPARPNRRAVRERIELGLLSWWVPLGCGAGFALGLLLGQAPRLGALGLPLVVVSIYAFMLRRRLLRQADAALAAAGVGGVGGVAVDPDSTGADTAGSAGPDGPAAAGAEQGGRLAWERDLAREDGPGDDGPAQVAWTFFPAELAQREADARLIADGLGWTFSEVDYDLTRALQTQQPPGFPELEHGVARNVLAGETDGVWVTSVDWVRTFIDASPVIGAPAVPYCDARTVLIVNTATVHPLAVVPAGPYDGPEWNGRADDAPDPGYRVRCPDDDWAGQVLAGPVGEAVTAALPVLILTDGEILTVGRPDAILDAEQTRELAGLAAMVARSARTVDTR